MTCFPRCSPACGNCPPPPDLRPSAPAPRPCPRLTSPGPQKGNQPRTRRRPPGHQRAQQQEAWHAKIIYKARGHLAALFAESGQITGFHQSGSLVTRLLSEAGTFATAYVLLVLAALFVILVLRRGNEVARMLGLLYLAAAIALSYAGTKGTLEEQELYLLAIPSVVMSPVAVTLLRINHRAVVVAAVVVLTAQTE